MRTAAVVLSAGSSQRFGGRPKQFEELGGLATAVSLPKEQVDRLIAGGRRAIEGNEAVRALTR